MHDTRKERNDEQWSNQGDGKWHPDVSPQLRNRIEEVMARTKSEVREREPQHPNIENELPVLMKKEFSIKPPQVIKQESTPVKKVELKKEIKRESPPALQKKVLKKRRVVRPMRLLMLVVVLLVISGSIVYGGVLLYQSLSSKSNSESLESVLSEVSELVILPEGEEPSMATVTSVTELSGQEFFEKAEIGDKVLIFNKSKKAILYRPSTKEIVEIAPLTQ
jgi:hypothetical protein